MNANRYARKYGTQNAQELASLAARRARSVQNDVSAGLRLGMAMHFSADSEDSSNSMTMPIPPSRAQAAPHVAKARREYLLGQDEDLKLIANAWSRAPEDLKREIFSQAGATDLDDLITRWNKLPSPMRGLVASMFKAQAAFSTPAKGPAPSGFGSGFTMRHGY